MDLGFSPLSPADATPLSSSDTARVIAALIAQEGDIAPAAMAQAKPAAPLAPADGAFSATMATRLAEWRRE